MKLLGIDPGTRKIGLAVIDTEKGNFNVDFITEKGNFDVRFFKILKKIEKFLKENEIKIAAIEVPFLRSNISTYGKLMQIVGVIKYMLIEKNVKVIETSPMKVKSFCCGFQYASKDLVKNFFLMQNVDISSLREDEIDALLVAYWLKENIDRKVIEI